MSKKIRPCTCYVVDSTDATHTHVHVGCGRTTRSEFAPGHDAQLKSVLINAHRAGRTLRITGLLGDVMDVSPMQIAVEREWADFLTATPKAKASPSQRKSAEAERLSAEVLGWGTPQSLAS